MIRAILDWLLPPDEAVKTVRCPGPGLAASVHPLDGRPKKIKQPYLGHFVTLCEERALHES